MKLVAQTLASAVFGAAFFAAVLFWPAGTLHYWQAWVFLAVFALMTVGTSMILAVRHPDVLARRMKAGPTAATRPAHRVIITATTVLVAVTCVV